jgi:hypothetical protein
MKHEGYLLRLHSDSWAKISKKTRNAIRRAQRQGVRVELSQDMDAFKKLHFKPENLPTSLPANAELYLAFKGSEAVAGIVILRENGRLVYRYAGSNRVGRRCQANSYLIWDLVKRYTGTPHEYLDLGYSLRQSLNRFKRSFATSTYPIPDNILEEKGYFKLATDNFPNVLNDELDLPTNQEQAQRSLREFLSSRKSKQGTQYTEVPARAPATWTLNDRIFRLYEDEIYLHRLLFLKGRLQPNLPTGKKYAVVLTHSCSGDVLERLQSFVDLERQHHLFSTFFVEPDAVKGEGIEVLREASKNGSEIALHAATYLTQSKRLLETILGREIRGARMKHLLLDRRTATAIKQTGFDYDSSFGNYFPGWRNFLAYPFMYCDMLYEVPLCISSTYFPLGKKSDFVGAVQHFMALIRDRRGVLTIDMSIEGPPWEKESAWDDPAWVQTWDRMLMLIQQDHECVAVRAQDIWRTIKPVHSSDLTEAGHNVDLTAPKTVSTSTSSMN